MIFRLVLVILYFGNIEFNEEDNVVVLVSDNCE